MTFDVITGERAAELREKFIAAFLDTDSDYFREYPESSDYCGRFLWDCLKDNAEWKKLCTQEQAAEFLKTCGDVYFMWDFWLTYGQFRDKYPNSVIRANGGELGESIADEWNAEIEANKNYCYIPDRWFPSDIYVFDESFSWYVIFTHETEDIVPVSAEEVSEWDFVRVCFKSE